MFRMLLLLLTASFAWANPTSAMKAEVFEQGGGALPYRWTKVGEAPSPSLVIFLHGAGERGADNEAQLRHGVPDLLRWLAENQQSAVVLAPQCPAGKWWANLQGDFRSPEGARLSSTPSPIMGRLLALVKKVAEEQKVDPKRIYITGLSMGGFGSFAAVAHEADLFAAAMPVCGGGDPSTAAAMKAVPFWVFHGKDDRVVPHRASTVMVEALKQAGAQVKFTEYPGVGHDSWSATYGNPAVWKWLFAQNKG